MQLLEIWDTFGIQALDSENLRILSTMAGAGTEGFAKREGVAVGVFAEAARAMEDVLASHTLDEVAIDEYGPVDWNAVVAEE